MQIVPELVNRAVLGGCQSGDSGFAHMKLDGKGQTMLLILQHAMMLSEQALVLLGKEGWGAFVFFLGWHFCGFLSITWGSLSDMSEVSEVIQKVKIQVEL